MLFTPRYFSSKSELQPYPIILIRTDTAVECTSRQFAAANNLVACRAVRVDRVLSCCLCALRVLRVDGVATLPRQQAIWAASEL